MCDSARLSTKPRRGYTLRGRHRTGSGRCLPPLFVLALFLLLGCKGGHSGRDVPWGTADETDDDTTVYTLEETGGDTLLVGSAAYHDQAARAEELLRTLEDVKSPDMLLHAMDKYDQLHLDPAALSDADEQARLRALSARLKAAYAQACRDYQLPALGILQTIANVRQRLERCSSSAAFYRIVDARRGYFRELPEVHRLVAEPSQRGVVQKKANELLKLYQEKETLFAQ